MYYLLLSKINVKMLRWTIRSTRYTVRPLFLKGKTLPPFFTNCGKSFKIKIKSLAASAAEKPTTKAIKS